VEPGLSPCVHSKNTQSASKVFQYLKKKKKYTPASLSAKPPPQKDSGETRFFNATTSNHLAGFVAQPRPPGR
jgi:hypothetical protein